MTSARNAMMVTILLVAAVIETPASAGWKLQAAGQPVPVGSMTVTPATDWNQASARPGKQGVAWTKDGFGLNGLEWFAGVGNGLPLYRERNAKRNPMPKYDRMMVAPELVEFFERSFRVQNQLTDFVVEEVQPAKLGGHDGISVRYRYSLPNDALNRRGVARMAVAGKQLYIGNFYAPALHYFQAGVAEAQALMDSARF